MFANKQSRPARGAWVEIHRGNGRRDHHGSRPARGAWVEICFLVFCVISSSRAPQGARGLKFWSTTGGTATTGRAPQGARGLKLALRRSLLLQEWSRPARGAWVEIMYSYFNPNPAGSRPARGAWVEISITTRATKPKTSRPARGAWVEIKQRTNLDCGRSRRAPQGARGLK